MSKTITISSGETASRIHRNNTSYTTSRGATTSNYTFPAFGQAKTFWGYDWAIARGVFGFDLDLPNDAVVSAATFKFDMDSKSIDTNDFDIVIQTISGVDYPFTTAAYNITNFSGDGGSINTADIGATGWTDITLNATGISWILNGEDVITKLGIRSSREISDTEPTDDEVVSWDYIPGTPKLEVVYTALPSVSTSSAYSITETTAYCRGSLVNDHDDAHCDKIGICYNKTGNPTVADDKVEEEGTFSTGKYILKQLTDLDPGTDYYFKAYAHNVTGYGYGDTLEFTTEGVAAEITTQAATEKGYQCAMGNGTIVAGEPTERGFEIKLDFGEYKDSSSGTLANYIDHSVAGFEGDVTWDIVYKWNGVLTKTESETGTFEPEAYELVLGYPSVLGNPSSVFNDKLFKCESYTYRAYMVIGDTTYTGEWVAFDTLCDAGKEQQPTDDISEGNPIVPPTIPEEEIEYPPFEWEGPEIELPPFIFPDLPPWEFPDYPPISWIGDFYYRKPYTKKDLDDLRKKCIIYNKNSIEFALVLRHNMNVLRGFFNMMTDYMDKEEFNDFTDLIPPQRLKELYFDPLEVNDFRDMINGFIRNTIDNNVAVNRNFKLIQDGLSDYETESDDAYFKEINSNIKTVTEDNPDVHRLKRKIDSLNQEVSMNFSNIMRNLKIIRARLL